MENQEENRNYPENTKERILLAAREIFMRQGYAGATTRQIAAEAGVNEVTLFRHFGNKENIFKAAVEQGADLDQLFARMDSLLSGDFAADMQIIGKIFMRIMVERGDMVQMMLCEAAHFPEMQAVLVENPRRLREWLSGYLKKQILAGAVKPGNPQVMSQAFFGMFFSYGTLQSVLHDPLVNEVESEEITRQFVSIFISGSQNLSEE